MPKSSRSVPLSLMVLLVVWELFGGLYTLRMSPGALTHDVLHHLQYTRIIYYDHRLPAPHEGMETYQPPLYYMINSRLDVPSVHHPLWGRLLGLQFGLLALALIAWRLEAVGTSERLQAAILAFILTSPTFLFVFASYNNDALATLLSIAILATTWEMIRRPRASLALLLGALMTAALYTKLSVLYAAGAAGILVAFEWIRGRVSKRLAATWLVAVIVAGVLFLPWLIGHNYAQTGHLLPAPADENRADFEQVKLPQSPLRTLLTPPGTRRFEWKDPFAHGWGADPITKKYSFTAYLLSTWMFDEFEFYYLPGLVLWLMVMVHVGLALCGAAAARHTEVGRSALLVIGAGLLLFSSLIFRYPYATLMHFRYVAWIWLPLAILWAEAGRQARSAAPWGPRILGGALVLGTFLHLQLYYPLVHQAARWYY